MSSIYFSPVTSIFTNDAIGTLIIGMPGHGKTFMAVNLAANEICMGRRIIAIDPKDDFIKLKNIIPSIEVVNVNQIEEGSLNPFVFLKDCDAMTIMTIIEIILGDIDPDARGVLSGILQDFIDNSRKRNKYVDMEDVIDKLNKEPDGRLRNIARALQMTETSNYGRLLFTRKKNVQPLKIDEDESLVLSLLGMPLPSVTVNPADYTAEQRFTSSIVYILCKKLNEILRNHSAIPTTFFCDEAHILFANRELSNVIKDFLAMGRSLNTAVVLMSQSVKHFPEEIPQFMSNKFVFKSSIQDTKEFFDKYDNSNINPSTEINRPAMITTIANLDKGVCFYMDSASRSGIVHIISNFDASLLSSNPLERAAQGDYAS